MTRPRLIALGAVSLLAVATACSVTEATAHASTTLGADAATPTATVRRADIVGVLTLAGVVTQGAQVEIHAPASGTVRELRHDGLTLATADGDVGVTVPSAAVVDETLVADGQQVSKGMSLVRVTIPGLSVTASLDPGDLLRFTRPPLGARAQVKDGPGPFDCPPVDPVPTARVVPGQPDQTAVTFVCGIPGDVTVLAGMASTVVVQLERRDATLVLPVEAVAGTVQAGTVYRRAAGRVEEVAVGLGTTDGVDIEITSGLNEGDVVLVPGPWLTSGAG